MALRDCSAFWITSDDAGLVMAGIIPFAVCSWLIRLWSWWQHYSLQFFLVPASFQEFLLTDYPVKIFPIVSRRYMSQGKGHSALCLLALVSSTTFCLSHAVGNILLGMNPLNNSAIRFYGDFKGPIRYSVRPGALFSLSLLQIHNSSFVVTAGITVIFRDLWKVSVLHSFLWNSP